MAKTIILVTLPLLAMSMVSACGRDSASSAGSRSFQLMEATIDDVHAAYRSGQLTARQLVQRYLDRIAAYDQQGPDLNCIITLDPEALAEADRLDAEFKRTGQFVGSLHGIPVLVKDEIDTVGMPTTLGSAVFKDYRPTLDAFVIAELRKQGAIIFGKTTLGEFAAGDTYGSGFARPGEAFGASRNPYDLRGRWAALRAVPVHVSPRISQRWLWARRHALQFAAREVSTPWSQCVRPPA
jgi:Asp-tRNA(Asn)/Glu-tRNA(Gln) amidotransferase A subunit family amidase